MESDPAGVVGQCSLAEVTWVDEDGAPRAAGVVPLLRGGRPVLALTFDRSWLARSLATARAVDLVVREPRNTGPGWRPGGWRCTPSLTEDLEAEIYTSELVLQELRRYPPARRYADSPLLMREHWWYLPRLLVELEPVAGLSTPEPRSGSGDLLLVTTASDGSPVTSGARLDEGSLTPSWGPDPAPGAGMVHGQDATFPDLERWDTWSAPVQVLAGGVVTHDSLPEHPRVAMPGLLARWRAERRFASRCRRGLAAWQA